MICPVCGTDYAEDGVDDRLIELTGRCYACDFEEWLDNRIKEITERMEDDDRDSVDDS